MSTDNNSNAKFEMWSEAKELGGEYSPRNKRRVKGTARKKRQYKSPYKRARDAYIEEVLGHRYIRYSRRLTDIKEAKVKSEYIEIIKVVEKRMIIFFLSLKDKNIKVKNKKIIE